MKQSAGLLLYRKQAGKIEILLVHPGGPFWVKKDAGAWSIPKGEIAEGEEGLVAAKREFGEELGLAAPDATYVPLAPVKQSNKVVHAWAAMTDVDVAKIASNMITLEWPPKSGSQIEVPEVDKAGWFSLEKAKVKLVKGQIPLVDQLAEHLGTVVLDAPASESAQISLF
jgi:predicted NUDIX family NTP pyrophosphohydrolase